MECAFMAKRPGTSGRIDLLIRIIRSSGVDRAQMFTLDGWMPYPYLDYTGLGGDADWEPIEIEDVIDFIKESGVEVHPLADLP